MLVKSQDKRTKRKKTSSQQKEKENKTAQQVIEVGNKIEKAGKEGEAKMTEHTKGLCGTPEESQPKLEP